MNTYHAVKASELEREAEGLRKQLGMTLDDLADNLTPGRVLDEVLAYSRGGGASLVKGLGNAAAHNPVPTLLVGVGAAMFLSGKGRADSIPQGLSALFKSSGKNSRQTATETSIGGGAAGSVKGAAETAAAEAGRLASSVGSAASEFASTVGGAASSTASAIGETAVALGNEATDLAQATTEAAVERTRQLRDQGRAMIHDLRDRAIEFTEKQPLAVAILGVAVGALVAAALPQTATEDELMGDASDNIKDAASDVATQEVAHLSSKLGEVAEDISDAIVHGADATKEAAVDVVRDAVDKAQSGSFPRSP